MPGVYKMVKHTLNILQQMLKDFQREFQAAITCSKLTTEALEQGVKYVQR